MGRRVTQKINRQKCLFSIIGSQKRKKSTRDGASHRENKQFIEWRSRSGNNPRERELDRDRNSFWRRRRSSQTWRTRWLCGWRPSWWVRSRISERPIDSIWDSKRPPKPADHCPWLLILLDGFPGGESPSSGMRNGEGTQNSDVLDRCSVQTRDNQSPSDRRHLFFFFFYFSYGSKRPK